MIPLSYPPWPPLPAPPPVRALGSGNIGLALSWMGALASMTAAGYLCVFTCANDFGDVRGEVAVWRGIIGPRYVVNRAKLLVEGAGCWLACSPPPPPRPVAIPPPPLAASVPYTSPPLPAILSHTHTWHHHPVPGVLVQVLGCPRQVPVFRLQHLPRPWVPGHGLVLRELLCVRHPGLGRGRTGRVSRGRAQSRGPQAWAVGCGSGSGVDTVRGMSI